MNKKVPKTITLQELKKSLTNEQKQAIAAELQYYDLLTSFKQEREAQGISQEELAERAKINRTTLSKVESGNRNATIETLLRIAQALEKRLELKLS